MAHPRAGTQAKKRKAAHHFSIAAAFRPKNAGAKRATVS
jgi:hypothetical protein